MFLAEGQQDVMRGICILERLSDGPNNDGMVTRQVHNAYHVEAHFQPVAPTHKQIVNQYLWTPKYKVVTKSTEAWCSLLAAHIIIVLKRKNKLLLLFKKGSYQI